MSVHLPQIIHSIISDLAEHAFWRRAIIGGIIISLVCSLLSVYVVLKRMAFIGQGISHSALGGFALGILLFPAAPSTDLRIHLTALIFCLGIAFLIATTTRHSKISDDSAIGIFFVASMALGLIFLRSAPGYKQDVSGFLFGSIMAMTSAELLTMSALAALVIIPLLLFKKELLYYSFDEEMASISGIPVNFLHYLLLGLLSLTIIISAQMLGVLLVSAFLILPGTTAQILTQRFNRMIFLSIISGLSTTLAGIALSSARDWPTGAAIVIVQFALFATVFVIRKIQGKLSV